VPIGAALLVEGAAARQVLVSFGAHDDAFSVALVVSYFYPGLEAPLFFWLSVSRCRGWCWGCTS